MSNFPQILLDKSVHQWIVFRVSFVVSFDLLLLLLFWGISIHQASLYYMVIVIVIVIVIVNITITIVIAAIYLFIKL